MSRSDKVQTLLAILVYILIFVFIINAVSNVLDFSMILERRDFVIKGFVNSLLLSVFSLLVSIVIGFFLFLMILSKTTFIKKLAQIFNEIIMGTPILVLVFVMVYIVGSALGIDDKLMIGFVTLTLYISPYMANMFLSAYSSIDKSQFIVMDLYDFSYFDRYRYLILPQIIKLIIPALINNLSIIVKTTSILSTIGIIEIFYTVTVISNDTFRFIEGYLLLWFVYLIITIPLSLLAKRLSKRYGYEN